ncbi:MAG: aminomethyl transferase family protein [Planctomycetota bacterium]|nr:MAG: aminomethyl transferase family protein [Planctomycetota bacterium]
MHFERRGGRGAYNRCFAYFRALRDGSVARTEGRTAMPVGGEGYEAARRGFGWGAVADRAAIDVAGPDAAAFLQNLLSNDVASLEAGAGRFACFLTPKARIVAPLEVLRLGAERFWLLAPPGAASRCAQELARRVFVKRVEVAERPLMGWAFEGPQAAEAMEQLGFEGAAEPQQPLSHGTIELAGRPLRAVRMGLVPGSWRLWAESSEDEDAAVELEREIAARIGASAQARLGAQALETLRIEAGVPRWGAEIDSESFLPETGLERTHVSYTKGCYPGQEPVARVHFKGRTHRTIGLVALGPGQEVPAAGTVLYGEDGKERGRVTSAVWSPALGRPLALAVIRREIEPVGSVSRLGAADGPVVETVAAPLGGQAAARS